MKNVVLIGMPGSGKTTVAELLADKLRRPLADTDALIEGEVGAEISAIFATQGESVFRQRERETVLRVAATGGQIISTGGGVILDPTNMEALQKNGVIFFLDRPPEVISADNHQRRPLIGARKEQILALYTERIFLYRSYAQYCIENTQSADVAVAEILKKLKETGNCR